jgi:hypothetical protein
MNKKITTIFSVLIVVVFIAYIIYDTTRQSPITAKENKSLNYDTLPEKWKIAAELHLDYGKLKAISVSSSGKIYAGGDSFVSCYSGDLRLLWNLRTSYPVTALSNFGDTIFASTVELILVISSEGKLKDEWGPFEDKSFITSVTANRSWIAYADAGNKMVVILDKQGRVSRLIGQKDGQFILPSPYFDVALNESDDLYIANTGQRRIERRTIQGRIMSSFGEPGMAPGAFCGCCNPAHFVITPDGFITAEKGINRIKILDKKGDFVEFVSSRNKFVPSIPLDLATADGKTIFAANPADSKLYVFRRY